MNTPISGSSAIAGVYNAQDDQVLTISEAVEVGLLLRGTGLELLEAQVPPNFLWRILTDN